jgi:prepilin-type N-terminal cleavage/methylation domain-containing protein
VKQARSGFTIIEVLVAVTILAVGVVAMAGSAAAVTRMIGRGKMDTRAAQLATQQAEALRLMAYSTTPRCTALANGGPVTTDHVTLSWTVAVAATGTGRDVNVSASYATVRGVRTEVLTTYIEC